MNGELNSCQRAFTEPISLAEIMATEKKGKAKEIKEEESVRLQKFMADQGLCSRRKAEYLIEQGEVSVNGKIAELGQKVIPGKDRVMVGGKPIFANETETLTLLMNKPRGFVCTNEDPHNEKTVFDLLPKQFKKERLFCVGRLDKDSQGMLLITNDGSMANKITHPSSQIVKRYLVTLNRPYTPELIAAMLKGVETEEDGILKADKVIPAKSGFKKDYQIEVHISHGKKREIRRMVEACDFFVHRLYRFQIGALRMRNIPIGGITKLSRKEIDLLQK